MFIYLWYIYDPIVQIAVYTSCTFACPAAAAHEIMFSCVVYRDSFTKSVMNCVQVSIVLYVEL